MGSKKPMWQLEQEHCDIIKKTLKDLGFTDSMGQIRKWRGKEFHKALDGKHSSLDFENCICRMNSRRGR